MKKKQKNKILVGSLILISILALFYFQTGASLSVAYVGQCSLPNCVSGYSLQDSYCEGTTCYGVCEKPLPSYCGDYGDLKSISRNIVFDEGDNNDYFSTSQIFESPYKCYRYRAGGQIRITNRDPGGIFSLDSESHKIIFGGAGMEDSICSTQSEFWRWTNWNEVGQGTSGTARGAYGKYISYTDTTCGSQSHGSEGSLLLTIQYQEAPWIDNLVDTREVSCSFSCNVGSDCGNTGYIGSKTCSGGNVVQNYETNNCQSYQCSSSLEENIVEFCDYGCEGGSCIQTELLNYYRLENNQCSLVQIYESDRTYNDYPTLSECENLIQEQSILVYRLEDNCNSVYIRISQRTDNDYDTRALCMAQQSQKQTYYRLENNECNEIIIYPSDRTYNDYPTLSECEVAIGNGGGLPVVENLTELILGGIVVLLLIIFIVVWLVRRKPRRAYRGYRR